MSRSSRFSFVLISVALGAAACSQNVERAKRDFVARGDRYMSDGNAEAAIIEYRNALQKDPRFGEAYRKLASAEIDHGDLIEAVRAAKAGADLLPDVAEAQLEAGNLMLLVGRYQDARAYAQHVLARNSNDVRGRVLLGNAYAQLKDPDTAVHQFEEALRLDPRQAGIYTGLANAKAVAGDRGAAEHSFEQAIAMDPRSAQPRLALAEFYWSGDQLDRAEQVLQEAHAVVPRDTGVNLTLGMFYQATRRPEAAEKYLKTAAQAGGEPRLTLTLADYYIARDRVQDATSLLTPLVADRRYGALATMRLAGLAQMAGHGADALAMIDRAIAMDPKNARTLAAKSDLLRAQNRVDEADKTADLALAANPASAEAQFVRGRVYEAQGKFDSAKRAFTEVLRLNPRANAARVELAQLQLKDADKDAAQTAADAARAEPSNVAAWLTLARALVKQGDLAKAERLLHDVLQTAPQLAAAHAQLGSLLVAKHDVAGARASFEHALQIDPAQVEALGGLTALDFKTGDRKPALVRLDAAMARAPRNTGVLIVAASAYATANDHARAESLLRSALDVDASLMNAYALLGRLYMTDNRLDAARAEFEKLASRQERPVAALTAVGMTYMLQNDYPHAQQAFERVMQLDPKAPVAANDLAWIYLETGGSTELAVHLAEVASAALPNVAEAQDTLGWAYFKRGQTTDAIGALERSASLDPQSAETQYHLALALQQHGDRESARKAFQRYLSLDASSDRSVDVRRRLDSLGM